MAVKIKSGMTIIKRTPDAERGDALQFSLPPCGLHPGLGRAYEREQSGRQDAMADLTIAHVRRGHRPICRTGIVNVFLKIDGREV